LLQTQHDLPRAETAINENFAMIGGDERAISRASAAEHGQAEHGSQDIRFTSAYANGNEFVLICSISNEPFDGNGARAVTR
jgi:hypothetical protein